MFATQCHVSKRFPNHRFLLLVAAIGLLTHGVHATTASGVPYSPSIQHRSETGHGRKAVGYFIEWGVYERGYLVKDLPCDKLTHVNFAFIAPFLLPGTYQQFDHIPKADFKKSDGSNPSQDMYVIAAAQCTISNTVYSVGLAVDDEWACFQKTNYERRYHAAPQYGWRDDIYDSWDKPAAGGASGPGDRTAGIFGEFLGMKAAFTNISILASIGGWSYSYYFSELAANDESRLAFAQACKQMLEAFEGRDSVLTLFDGVDLDWEFPYAGGDSAVSHRAEDKDNLTALCSAIREQIGSSKLLTIATAQNYRNIPNQYDAELATHLDFLCIMAYDYCGTWSSKTGIEAPLYGGNTNDPLYNPADGKYMVIAEVVSSFLAEGFDASSLVLGLPFYGRSFANVTDENNGLYQPFSGAGVGSYDAGSLEFNDIADGLKNNKMLSRTNGQWSGANGYTRYWNDNSQTPYLFNGNSMVSYDDDLSLAVKVAYAIDQGLGGVMIWELSSDTRFDSAEPNLLMNAVNNALWVPNAPGALSASDGSYSGKIRVTWNASSLATSYEVWRHTENDSGAATMIASNITNTCYDDATAEPGNIYYYWVKASNNTGTSGFSTSDEGRRQVTLHSDFIGDGTTQLTLYHEATGTWLILFPDGSISSTQLGGVGFKPTLGDHDGDGKSDMALYDEASGYWYMLLSSKGYAVLDTMQFGGPGYSPVSGDFDGDGKSDIAVYHEATGYWWILLSGSDYALASQKFGEPGYVPVSGDFDGDGKSDVAVYNEETGYWWIILSGSNYLISYQKFGGHGYVPAT